jgi:hypothetical protein
MFASINLDGATESVGKQVLTRDGTAAPASRIETIPAITAPDVRCLKADGLSGGPCSSIQRSAKSYLDRCVAVSTCGVPPVPGTLSGFSTCLMRLISPAISSFAVAI